MQVGSLHLDILPWCVGLTIVHLYACSLCSCLGGLPFALHRVCLAQLHPTKPVSRAVLIKPSDVGRTGTTKAPMLTWVPEPLATTLQFLSDRSPSSLEDVDLADLGVIVRVASLSPDTMFPAPALRPVPSSGHAYTDWCVPDAHVTARQHGWFCLTRIRSPSVDQPAKTLPS